MKKLFTCLFGSKLYGTSTPTSDRDVKHVTLMPLDDLLLGKKVSNTVNKTNKAANTRNSKDDVDEELIPVQVFARDFMAGQTYALELAFALEGHHAEQTFYCPRGMPLLGTTYRVRDVNFEEWDEKEVLFLEFTRQLRTKFLTSNIKAMMGYVVNQASLYSFKGERLNASREFLVFLNEGLGLFQTDQQHATLGDLFDPVLDVQFQTMAKVTALQAVYPKYVKLTEYDIGGNRMKPCITLLEKTFPFTNKLEHSVKVCETMIKKYGSRADAASETNVDWKATMHALRIVDEGLKLLSEKQLSFPFEPDYVEKLLSIKRGEVPLAEVTQELTDKLDRLKTLEKETSLPAYTAEMNADFEKWLAWWMRKFYDL